MNKTKFPYRVKYNGKFYPPNTEISVRDNSMNNETSTAEAKTAAALEKPVRKKTAKSSTAQ